MRSQSGRSFLHWNMSQEAHLFWCFVTILASREEKAMKRLEISFFEYILSTHPLSMSSLETARPRSEGIAMIPVLPAILDHLGLMLPGEKIHFRSKKPALSARWKRPFSRSCLLIRTVIKLWDEIIEPFSKLYELLIKCLLHHFFHWNFPY